MVVVCFLKKLVRKQILNGGPLLRILIQGLSNNVSQPLIDDALKYLLLLTLIDDLAEDLEGLRAADIRGYHLKK
jgi:hypothetical protein